MEWLLFPASTEQLRLGRRPIYEEHREDEERWITLGQSREAQTLVVVHTYREGSDNNATIRIISARKATKHEQ